MRQSPGPNRPLPTPDGMVSIFRGGAVYFENAHNCTVTNCFFDQVGSNGVMVSEYNSNVDIDKCRFVAAGSSAVAFVGNRHRAHGTYAAFPTDCSVKNSFMAELGYFDKQVAGVFISNSQRINVSHNLVRNVPRAGLLMNDGLESRRRGCLSGRCRRTWGTRSYFWRATRRPG